MQPQLELQPLRPSHCQGGLLSQRRAVGGAGHEDQWVHLPSSVEGLRPSSDGDQSAAQQHHWPPVYLRQHDEDIRLSKIFTQAAGNLRPVQTQSSPPRSPSVLQTVQPEGALPLLRGCED